MHRGIALQKEQPIKKKKTPHTTHASGWGFWHNKDLMEAHMGWGSVLGFSFCLPHFVLPEQSTFLQAPVQRKQIQATNHA